ncbi:choline/carnitine O-acyltransferase [Calothrix rhizosoleniae]|uniref:choline/carnitine O-acyltransferase n=1 Tax=Calothrix rhizosoleniae TaxID=888997 RepID=UPI000B4A2F82|nr:choline/carnitine O-acyltransferase [Calothrix rhizosoleniae]
MATTNPQLMMYQYQESLPKLPVPTLAQTCDLYLQMVAPMLTEAEFKQTQGVVRDFQEGVGVKLQKQLEMVASSTKTSYVHDYREESFAEYRGILPINKNFGIILSPIAQPELPVSRLAATWIVDTLKFYLKIKHRELEPDRDSPRSGNQPMCMIQYDNLFGWNRIPGIKRDKMFKGAPHPDGKEHIIIIRNSAFYLLQPLSGDKIAAIADIEQQIDGILANTNSSEPAIGALTAIERAPWAVLRQGIEALSPENARALELIDSALFVVCLDNTKPTDLVAASQNMLHGDGRNRWFDKPLQIIFTDNSITGINVEHVGLDGYVIMRYLYEVNQERKAQASQEAQVNPTLPLTPATKLEWKLNPEIEQSIREAEAQVDNFIAANETLVLDFPEFGRNFIKEQRLSPDAVVQMAFQLAYFRLHHKIDCVYESIHTRRFKYGRTEAMRSLTPESLALVKAMTSDASCETKYTALKQAVNAHVTRQKAAQSAYGVDRHLAALLRLARAQGIIPPIFQDKAYKLLGESPICTSNLATGMGIDLFCFGPVIEHGYGLGYIINPDSITVNITSKYQQTGKYSSLLRESLQDLATVMKSSI